MAKDCSKGLGSAARYLFCWTRYFDGLSILLESSTGEGIASSKVSTLQSEPDLPVSESHSVSLIDKATPNVIV